MRRLATTLIVIAALIAAPSPRAALAQASADKQQAEDFEFVKRLGSRRGWEAFLKTYPNGPYADRARQELSKQPGVGRKAEPNWGDDIFIKRQINRQRQ